MNAMKDNLEQCNNELLHYVAKYEASRNSYGLENTDVGATINVCIQCFYFKFGA